MKRTVITGFLIWGCFLLQSTVFQALEFGGIAPNLLIVLTASLGFMRGEKTGLLTGFFCGLLCDIFSGNVIGFYALTYMYIGYLNGKFSRMFYPEDIKLPLALILISDFSYCMICYILMFLLRGRLEFFYYFLNVILPEVVYTAVITMVLYPSILWIYNRLLSKEKRSAAKFV